jgi:hypothetical protein
MLGDQSNELGSEQRRELAKEIRKLKRLQRQPTMSHEEVRRIVNEVALTVFCITTVSAEVKRHS